MGRRTLLAAIPVLALVACGFTPVYGPGGEALSLRGAVIAAEPDTDITFAFVRQIEQRLGLPTQPSLGLSYTLATASTGLAIDESNNVTRFTVEGRLTWALTPLGEEEPTLTGEEIAFTAYSGGESPLAALESERDALRRLAVLLADQVVARLLAEAP
ncbi:MAG: LPS assembly lipoprotein LptE [Pseudomonadota bacterium]